MAKSRVTFNDGTARTLQSDWPEPGSRFANWRPDTRPIGQTGVALADEAIHMFRTSTRYGCHFEIHGLGMGASAGSALDIANKLKAHLLGGGTCAVVTEDALGSSYASCGLMPGTEPEVVQVDRRAIEYVMRLSLINRAAAEMICHYG